MARRLARAGAAWRGAGGVAWHRWRGAWRGRRGAVWHLARAAWRLTQVAWRGAAGVVPGAASVTQVA